MTEPTPILPGRTRNPAPLRACAPPVEAEIRALSEPELEALRATLRQALCGLPLGSRPSALLGRLSRLVRAELRRRTTPAPRDAHPPAA